MSSQLQAPLPVGQSSVGRAVRWSRARAKTGPGSRRFVGAPGPAPFLLCSVAMDRWTCSPALERSPFLPLLRRPKRRRPAALLEGVRRLGPVAVWLLLLGSARIAVAEPEQRTATGRERGVSLVERLNPLSTHNRARRARWAVRKMLDRGHLVATPEERHQIERLLDDAVQRPHAYRVRGPSLGALLRGLAPRALSGHEGHISGDGLLGSLQRRVVRSGRDASFTVASIEERAGPGDLLGEKLFVSLKGPGVMLPVKHPQPYARLSLRTRTTRRGEPLEIDPGRRSSAGDVQDFRTLDEYQFFRSANEQPLIWRIDERSRASDIEPEHSYWRGEQRLADVDALDAAMAPLVIDRKQAVRRTPPRQLESGSTD